MPLSYLALILFYAHVHLIEFIKHRLYDLLYDLLCN